MSAPPSYEAATSQGLQGLHPNLIKLPPIQPPINPDFLKSSLEDIAGKYEINQKFKERMSILEGYHIVVVLDDSGSMSSCVNSKTPYGNNYTRFDELKQSCKILIDIISIFQHNGVDLHFLNRGIYKGVRNYEEVEHLFNQPPRGGTPIAKTLKNIYHSYTVEKPLLVLVFTDGCPTNDFNQIDIQGLGQLLVHRPNIQKSYITFVMCTDEDDVVEIYNHWDCSIYNLDVVDDYQSEKAEILRAQGKHFPFSFGDYIVKCLLGAIDQYFDKLDEPARGGPVPISYGYQTYGMSGMTGVSAPRGQGPYTGVCYRNTDSNCCVIL